MFSIADEAKIFLYGNPVDLRNGFDGLSFLAQTCFKIELDPHTYFVFINLRRTRMKILYWSGDNLAVWYFKLRKGTFFQPGHLLSSEITKSDLKKIMDQKMPNAFLLP